MHELHKVFKIFNLILKSIFRSVFFKNQESKNFLTSLYLKEIYSQSKINLVSLKISPDINITLSASQLLSPTLKMHERLTLQSPSELFALISLLKKRNPSKIFEFGVMYGGSLLHLYLNTESNVTIDSLDVDLNKLDKRINKIIKDNPRITLHHTDSLLFNELPFQGVMDFIFIDGNHDYEFVKSDTEKAFNMLAPKGIIVWDDYSLHFPGVYRFINELSKRYPNLYQIEGTSLVAFES